MARLTLDCVRVGTECKICELRLSDELRRRILDLGLIADTRVKVLQKSPAGDPTAYFVRGTVISLRNSDARGILVEVDTDDPNYK